MDFSGSEAISSRCTGGCGLHHGCPAADAGLAGASPSRVAFLMGSEPVFGAIFAALLMGETLTRSGWAGAILIVLATTLVLQRNRANG